LCPLVIIAIGVVSSYLSVVFLGIMNAVGFVCVVDVLVLSFV